MPPSCRHLTWTIALGEAFLAQDKEVMDAIQAMRGRAREVGTLQTTPQQVVVVTNMVIERTIERQVVYVPTYHPYTVYWGGGSYHGDVDVDIDIDRNINRNDPANPQARPRDQAGTTGANQKWQPDQNRVRTSGSPTAAASAGSREERAVPQPFRGYFVKVLTRQGKAAPGGKFGYVIHGNMIGGFALVAWPAEYGQSGIMTFMVNQQGRVYQKDLGEKTAKTAAKIKAYDPDKTWTISRE